MTTPILNHPLNWPRIIGFDEDPQAKQYEHNARLWMENKISFETLMDTYPEYNESMIKGFFVCSRGYCLRIIIIPI